MASTGTGAGTGTMKTASPGGSLLLDVAIHPISSTCISPARVVITIGSSSGREMDKASSTAPSSPNDSKAKSFKDVLKAVMVELYPDLVVSSLTIKLRQSTADMIRSLQKGQQQQQQLQQATSVSSSSSSSLWSLSLLQIPLAEVVGVDRNNEACTSSSSTWTNSLQELYILVVPDDEDDEDDDDDAQEDGNGTNKDVVIVVDQEEEKKKAVLTPIKDAAVAVTATSAPPAGSMFGNNSPFISIADAHRCRRLASPGPVFEIDFVGLMEACRSLRTVVIDHAEFLSPTSKDRYNSDTSPVAAAGGSLSVPTHAVPLPEAEAGNDNNSSANSPTSNTDESVVRPVRLELTNCYGFFSAGVCNFLSTSPIIDLSSLRKFGLSQSGIGLCDDDFFVLCATVVSKCPTLEILDLSDCNISKLWFGPKTDSLGNGSYSGNHFPRALLPGNLHHHRQLSMDATTVSSASSSSTSLTTAVYDENDDAKAATATSSVQAVGAHKASIVAPTLLDVREDHDDTSTNRLLKFLPPTLRVFDLSRNPALNPPCEYMDDQNIGDLNCTFNHHHDNGGQTNGIVVENDQNGGDFSPSHRGRPKRRRYRAQSILNDMNRNALWYMVARLPVLGFTGKFNILFLGRKGEHHHLLTSYRSLVHELGMNRCRSRIVKSECSDRTASSVPATVWPVLLSKASRAFDDYQGTFRSVEAVFDLMFRTLTADHRFLIDKLRFQSW